MNNTLGGDQGTKHAPPDLKADIESLMNSLDENDIYRIRKGRIIKEEDMVKDVVAVGLRNLMSEKNPISDYNSALKRLQTRRKMTPVSLTTLPKNPIARPQTTPVPFSPTPFETPPILPSAAEVNEITEGDIVTQQTSEVEQILQDLENGVVDETLPRLSEEDVAFDMDEVVVDEVILNEDSESEDSSDEDEGDT